MPPISGTTAHKTVKGQYREPETDDNSHQRKPRTRKTQFEFYVNFLERRDGHLTEEDWEDLVVELNDQGPEKNLKEWKNVFQNYKYRITQKKGNEKILSDVENRALALFNGETKVKSTPARPQSSVSDVIDQLSHFAISDDSTPTSDPQFSLRDVNVDAERRRRLEAWLCSLQQDQRRIFDQTISQNSSPLWKDIRRKLLTASNFGRVMRRQKEDCSKLVHAMLSSANLDNIPAIKWGRENEACALRQLSRQIGREIQKSGLFVSTDPRCPFLAASPDGLVEKDALVEIKCPYSLAGRSVEEVKRLCSYLRYDEREVRICLWRHHDYYYQIQGQLNISGRKNCYFAIWTSPEEELYVERIERDEELWEEMLGKLGVFYKEKLVPEIIDSKFF